MHWPKELLNAILGWIRNNEKQQEERRSSRRLEYDRMMDLTIQAIRNKELKSFVRNKTERVVKILSDTKKRI